MNLESKKKEINQDETVDEQFQVSPKVNCIHDMKGQQTIRERKGMKATKKRPQ